LRSALQTPGTTLLLTACAAPGCGSCCDPSLTICAPWTCCGSAAEKTPCCASLPASQAPPRGAHRALARGQSLPAPAGGRRRSFRPCCAILQHLWSSSRLVCDPPSVLGLSGRFRYDPIPRWGHKKQREAGQRVYCRRPHRPPMLLATRLNLLGQTNWIPR